MAIYLYQQIKMQMSEISKIIILAELEIKKATYINLILMQKYFSDLFNSIKQKLCARRRNSAAINPFVQIKRTMVRKSNKLPVSNVAQNLSIIQIQPISSQQPRIQQPQLIKEPEIPQVQRKLSVKPSMYTVKALQKQQKEQENKSQAVTSPEQQLVRCQARLDDYEDQLDKVIEQIRFLEQKDQQRKKQFWKHVYTNFSNEKLDQDLSNIVDDHQQHNDELLTQNELYTQYKAHIQDTRDLKYSLQLIDYPDISFDEYSHIRTLWALGKKNPSHLIKNMKLKILQKLLGRSFRTLSFGVWLNDEIINAYLEMIDNKSTQIGKKYKVLNSFFAKTTFSKSKQMVSRALKRKNISEQNQVIIAINNGNHWFFAQIIDQKVIVYDSIPKDKCSYQTSESTRQIFTNIIEFSNWFYGGQHEIQVEERYPKQNNNSDCGMFLLCGIKDIVRGYKQWSFSQNDIPYKRIHVAKELLNQEISGFDL